MLTTDQLIRLDIATERILASTHDEADRLAALSAVVDELLSEVE